MTDPLTPVRHLDLAILLIALPVFIVAGWPILGWVAGGGVYLLQKAIGLYATRKAKASNDPRTIAGVLTGSLIGRGWLVALTIFGVGLADNDTGLAAGVLFLALFTAYFTANLITRPFDNHQPTT